MPPTALDTILASQAAHARREPHLSDAAQVYVATAASAAFGVGYVVATHHFALLFALLTEHSGRALSIIALPVAACAALLRFNARATALILGAALLAASAALVVAANEGRGFAVLYALLGGDFVNAFWGYPPVMLNIVMGAVVGGGVLFIVSRIRDSASPLV